MAGSGMAGSGEGISGMVWGSSKTGCSETEMGEGRGGRKSIFGALRTHSRAEVMSRNGGKKKKGLFALTVFFLKKAHPLLRVTVVRESISVCEDRVITNTLQSDVTRITECPTATPFSSE